MSTRIYNASSSGRRHSRSSTKDTPASSPGQPSAGSPPSSPASVARPDPFYGSEVLSTQASRYIAALFSCSESARSNTSSSHGSSLGRFIAYTIYRSRLPREVALSALILLTRLKTRFPACTGSSGHRLWLCSFILASKVLCDDTYSNKSWAVCGQDMFSVKEINQMEREMLDYLGWEITCSLEELEVLQALLNKAFSSSVPTIPSFAQPVDASSTSKAVSSYPSPARATLSYPSPPSSPVEILNPLTINISNSQSSIPTYDHLDHLAHSPSNSSLSSTSTMPEPSTPLDAADHASLDDEKDLSLEMEP